MLHADEPKHILLSKRSQAQNIAYLHAPVYKCKKTESKLGVAYDVVWEQGPWLQMGMRELFRAMLLLCSWVVVMAAPLYNLMRSLNCALTTGEYYVI